MSLKNKNPYKVPFVDSCMEADFCFSYIEIFPTSKEATTYNRFVRTHFVFKIKVNFCKDILEDTLLQHISGVFPLCVCVCDTVFVLESLVSTGCEHGVSSSDGSFDKTNIVHKKRFTQHEHSNCETVLQLFLSSCACAVWVCWTRPSHLTSDVVRMQISTDVYMESYFTFCPW